MDLLHPSAAGGLRGDDDGRGDGRLGSALRAVGGLLAEGTTIFEAADEDAARRILEEDPAISSGIARGELRPFEVALLQGRD